MKAPWLLALSIWMGCGSRSPQPATAHDDPDPPGGAAPTANGDAAKRRHDPPNAIVAAGATCLPPTLKGDAAPRLEIAAKDADIELCAIDTDPARLLGPIACWMVNLKDADPKTGAATLTYKSPAPLPGHNVDALFDGKCARGYCLPDGGNSRVGHLSWSLDGSKVAVLSGDSVHIFDAASKAHASSFPTKGAKGPNAPPVAVYFADDALFVEARDDSSDTIWGYKPDGTSLGAIMPLGGKADRPLSIAKGSFSVIDPSHVALADHGMETLTTYEVATGKRQKSVRKVGKIACKPAEIEAYWAGSSKVPDDCRNDLDQSAKPLIGATLVMGKSNLLVVLHGDRLGELGVFDPKSLTEAKQAFHLPWCGGDAGAHSPAKQP